MYCPQDVDHLITTLTPPSTGHIPAEIGLLTALKGLFLWNNELTGESSRFANFPQLM